MLRNVLCAKAATLCEQEVELASETSFQRIPQNNTKASYKSHNFFRHPFELFMQRLTSGSEYNLVPHSFMNYMRLYTLYSHHHVELS